MYMPGRVRTCSMPSSTLIMPSVYPWSPAPSVPPALGFTGVGRVVLSVTFSSGILMGSDANRGSPADLKNGRVSSRALSSKTSVDSRVATHKRPVFAPGLAGENRLLRMAGIHTIGRDVAANFNGAD